MTEDLYMQQGKTRQLMHLLNSCGIPFEYKLEESSTSFFDVLKFKTLEGIKLEFVNTLTDVDNAFFAIEDDKDEEKTIRRIRKIS